MFNDAWQPSAGSVVFHLYRSPSPRCCRIPKVLDVTFGSRTLSRSSNLRQLEVIAISVLTNQRRKIDPLWLANVSTFVEPSGSATFARGRIPTLAPRGRGPTPTGRTLEEERSIKTLVRKRLPRRSEVGVNRRYFWLHASRADSPSV